MIEVCLRSSAPLDDNEKRKISKKAVKEDHLWYKLVPDNIALCEFPFSLPPLFKERQHFKRTNVKTEGESTDLISIELPVKRALK